MLRQNIENDGNEHDAVELSRRSFFGRLALGAALSIAMPGVVHAAKSAAVKTDKNHRLSGAAKSAVRLPKQTVMRTAKAGDAGKKVSAHHAVGRATTGHQHKVASAKHGHLQTAQVTKQAQHGRVRDVYAGKKQAVHSASHHTGRRQLEQGGKGQTLIQPVERETIFQTAQEPMWVADHGRLATHRALAFQNPHTGDKLNLTYFEKGRYLTDALDEISFLLRDYRTEDVHPIDPELLDQLHDLKQMLGLHQPFDVICGYRSPLTNARLHAEHVGVANNSFHMQGRAVDIRIERFDLRRIHNAALAMHRGGVGYYPGSNFIHLDTGTFRTWKL